MKLKVLSLTTVYPTAAEPGAGVFIRSRLQELARYCDVHVLSPEPYINYSKRRLQLQSLDGELEQDARLTVTRPRWFYPPSAGAMNGAFLFLGVLRAANHLRSTFGFHVIDAHFAHPEGVAAALLAARFGCPFTVTIRGSEQMHSLKPFRRRTMSWALRRATRVIAVSERLRRLAMELGVEADRVVTIPNGIDKDAFYPRQREPVRSRYGVSGEQWLIVSAGHLIELKGHHLIIDVIPDLISQGVDVVLLIAGGSGRAGNYEPNLRQQIDALGLQNRVRLLGHVERSSLASLASAADVFCLASSREGWPNVLHEAMACGTPVVASNVGGVPEMIPSEEYGIIVPPVDRKALSAALLRAFGKTWNRENIAAWGRSRSWDHVARETLVQIERAYGDYYGHMPATRDC